MLDLIVIIANGLTALAMYHYVTHNVPAAIFGFLMGCATWFIFFKE